MTDQCYIADDVQIDMYDISYAGQTKYIADDVQKDMPGIFGTNKINHYKLNN